MASKHANTHGYSSDNEDSYSTYSEDFERDSRSPSPDNKHRYNSGNKRLKKDDFTSDATASSLYTSSAKKTVVRGINQRRKSKASSVKSGRWASSLPAKNAKSKPTIAKDSVQARMLSARNHRINSLNNELFELQSKTEELTKENKLLKTLQHRQDKALRKFEDTESDLPRLLAQHADEQKVLKTRMRKSQDSERVLEGKLRDSNEELQRMELTLRRLKKIVYDKNLGERSELAKQLHTAEDKSYDLERKNKELEKKLELTTHSYARQLNGEKAKHRETKEKLESLQEEFAVVQTKLKEKERALEVVNIYALRVKQTPEKSFVGGRAESSSPRQQGEKRLSVRNDPSSFPIANTPRTLALTNTSETANPLFTNTKVTTDSTSAVGDFRKTVKSPAQQFQTEREESVLLDLGTTDKVDGISTNLNGLRLHQSPKKKEESIGSKPGQSIFLTANFESPFVTPDPTFIAEEAISKRTPPSRRRISPIGRPDLAPSPIPKADNIDDILKMVENTKKEDEASLEEENKQFQEVQRKKAALLARMKDLENDIEVVAPLGGKKKDADDISKLLSNGLNVDKAPLVKKQKSLLGTNPRNSFERQLIKHLSEGKTPSLVSAVVESLENISYPSRSAKRRYNFSQEVENLHKGVPSNGDLTKLSPDASDPELTFGGYAPTVALQPKRKSTRTKLDRKKSIPTATDSENDEPLLDLASGKTSKPSSHLLQQLFGDQAASSSAPNKRENSLRSPPDSLNTSSVSSKGKAVHSGYPWEQNVMDASRRVGNGDGSLTKEKRKNFVGSSAIKPNHLYSDDDIEEMTL